LRTVAAVAPPDVAIRWFERLADVPAFHPDDDGTSHPAVAELRDEVTRADAVLLCSPEYTGTPPGSFENLLAWTVGTGEFHGMPTAVLNVAPNGRGEGAASALQAVLDFHGAAVDSKECVQMPVSVADIGSDGLVHADAFRDAATGVLTVLAGR
jgi:NAD(P)H-dependent FMN reductase